MPGDSTCQRLRVKTTQMPSILRSKFLIKSTNSLFSIVLRSKTRRQLNWVKLMTCLRRFTRRTTSRLSFKTLPCKLECERLRFRTDLASPTKVTVQEESELRLTIAATLTRAVTKRNRKARLMTDPTTGFQNEAEEPTDDRTTTSLSPRNKQKKKARKNRMTRSIQSNLEWPRMLKLATSDPQEEETLEARA